VRRGRAFTVREYAILMLAPFALALVLAAEERSAGLLAPLVLVPWVMRLVARVRREPAGAWLNGALATTAKLGLAFSLLLSVGATLGR
jgi:1,4-dihydroxy-2-naphthoate octaprenyltransferase